jgi:hypothetical protein
LGGSRLIIISWFFLGVENDNEPPSLSLSLGFFPQMQKMMTNRDLGSSLSFVVLLQLQKRLIVIFCISLSCRRRQQQRGGRLVIVSWFFSFNAKDDDEPLGSFSSFFKKLVVAKKGTTCHAQDLM